MPVHAFAPPLPVELRDRTLAAVSARAANASSPAVLPSIATGTRTRSAARWIVVASTVAAAAVVFMMVRPSFEPSPPRPVSTFAAALKERDRLNSTQLYEELKILVGAFFTFVRAFFTTETRRKG